MLLRRAVVAIAAGTFALAAMGQSSCDVGDTASGSGSGFCAKHECIPSFNEGDGSIVQCEDGMWSHSGGQSGTCSWHGGEKSGAGW